MGTIVPHIKILLKQDLGFRVARFRAWQGGFGGLGLWGSGFRSHAVGLWG